MHSYVWKLWTNEQLNKLVVSTHQHVYSTWDQNIHATLLKNKEMMKKKLCTFRLEITREQTAAGVNKSVYKLILYTLATRLTHPVRRANVKSWLICTLNNCFKALLTQKVYFTKCGIKTVPKEQIHSIGPYLNKINFLHFSAQYLENTQNNINKSLCIFAQFVKTFLKCKLTTMIVTLTQVGCFYAAPCI